MELAYSDGEFSGGRISPDTVVRVAYSFDVDWQGVEVGPAIPVGGWLPVRWRSDDPNQWFSTGADYSDSPRR